jgi:sterol desaturase/sphingolipid hydroxylase (fatty acid hydroxylase superfamily)
MTETSIRLSVFIFVLVLMMALEYWLPAKQAKVAKSQRWLGNFGLTIVSTFAARLIVPMGLTGIAIYANEQKWGLFNQFNWPVWAVLLLSCLLLDIMIYWQHRLFHRVPLFWRLHKVHHADSHVDASTGLRFHPLEILLSIVIKGIAIMALGVPVLAVIIFEIMLNGFALFNHANIRLPDKVERVARYFLITQVLHRIHHSQVAKETNTNFGFSVSWWDYLFGSYKGESAKGDADIELGLKEYPKSSQNAAFWSLLKMPFLSIKQNGLYGNEPNSSSGTLPDEHPPKP